LSESGSAPIAMIGDYRSLTSYWLVLARPIRLDHRVPNVGAGRNCYPSTHQLPDWRSRRADTGLRTVSWLKPRMTSLSEGS
jgi:hypothetical protein